MSAVIVLESAADLTPETRLKLAGNAWQVMLQAEATISRLTSYKHRNHQMQADLFAAHHRLNESRAALNQLLRAPLLPLECETEVTGVSSQARAGGSFNSPCATTGDPS